MCIMVRDKSIIRFFNFPFCGGFSLHLQKMVEETSRELTIVKGCLKRANADISISWLLNGRKHIIEEKHNK